MIKHRQISNRRARKLIKRGEYVYWSICHDRYVWIMRGANEDT